MRKAKNYGWPHMFYCIADGTYLTCETLADVPEGFADTRMECDVEPVGEPSPYTGERPATKDEKVVADEDDDDDDNEPNEPDDDKPVTLESLKVTRKEAIALLTEEKVVFKKNIKGPALAALVQQLLDEDKD